jgi:hypothetical protein
MKSLFDALPRRPRRILAHVIDVGPGEVHQVVRFGCSRCGWKSEWMHDKHTVTEARRGIPFPATVAETPPAEPVTPTVEPPTEGAPSPKCNPEVRS